MRNPIIEIPGSLSELFDNGESSYRIIDYSSDMEMDNVQSMQYFLDAIGVCSDDIVSDGGTQVVLKCEGYEQDMVVDSRGLGDFFSHGFDVTIFEQ